MEQFDIFGLLSRIDTEKLDTDWKEVTDEKTRIISGYDKNMYRFVTGCAILTAIMFAFVFVLLYKQTITEEKEGMGSLISMVLFLSIVYLSLIITAKKRAKKWKGLTEYEKNVFLVNVTSTKYGFLLTYAEALQDEGFRFDTVSVEYLFRNYKRRYLLGDIVTVVKAGDQKKVVWKTPIANVLSFRDDPKTASLYRFSRRKHAFQVSENTLSNFRKCKEQRRCLGNDLRQIEYYRKSDGEYLTMIAVTRQLDPFDVHPVPSGNRYYLEKYPLSRDKSEEDDPEIRRYEEEFRERKYKDFVEKVKKIVEQEMDAPIVIIKQKE